MRDPTFEIMSNQTVVFKEIQNGINYKMHIQYLTDLDIASLGDTHTLAHWDKVWQCEIYQGQAQGKSGALLKR